MIRERIIYTRPGGLVSVMQQSRESLAAMTGDGYGLPDLEGGYYGPDTPGVEAFMAEQVRRLVETGRQMPAALAWVRAHVYGGISRDEARRLFIAICGDPAGKAYEVIDVSELPPSRWFRDAWRRSEDGGPIWIDLDAAREIHAARLVALREAELARLQGERDKALLTGRLHNMVPALLDAWRTLDFASLARAFSAAETPDDLVAAIDVEALLSDPSSILGVSYV